MPPRLNPVKISHATYTLLIKIQEGLPGKPTQISLLREAVKLLAEKHGVKPTILDEFRCESRSQIRNLRCDLLKHHEGQCEHFPYVWGKMGTPEYEQIKKEVPVYRAHAPGEEPL